MRISAGKTFPDSYRRNVPGRYIIEYCSIRVMTGDENQYLEMSIKKIRIKVQPGNVHRFFYTRGGSSLGLARETHSTSPLPLGEG